MPKPTKGPRLGGSSSHQKAILANLATALFEQRALFNQECVTGQPADIALHGESLCRGYQVCARAMEEAGADDDAYLLGSDPVSGLKVAIGYQRAAAAHIKWKYIYFIAVFFFQCFFKRL